ncbi:hypothetical protein [Kamptonema formosum]|uniref:hypothetical protein n=1 Tax=Kamptonema formosum TaxID=331992 RepID=UPI00034D102E|nr:hypothetical protein [Oscillatoria sp. PCC 10802]
MTKEQPVKGKRGRGIGAAPAAAVSGGLEQARNCCGRNAAGREWLSVEAGSRQSCRRSLEHA